MPTLKQTLGARTALACAAFPTLASATYAASATYDCNTNQPSDIIVEVTGRATTPASSKQVVVFIKESLDGVVFRSGPESGTVTTDEPNLKLLGALPILTSATDQVATFSVQAALGYIPHSFMIVVKNECGVALTAGTIYTSEIIDSAV